MQRDGVQFRLNTSVTEVHPDHVVLGRQHDQDALRDLGGRSHGCRRWQRLRTAQGAAAGSSGARPYRRGFPNIYALGDFANITGPDGKALPQLGSVALQSGRWAAKNILADLEGKPRRPFHYLDKGIMAMIGRNAAIAEVGEHRHELERRDRLCHVAGVHLALLTTLQVKVETFVEWIWDYFLGGAARNCSTVPMRRESTGTAIEPDSTANAAAAK